MKKDIYLQCLYIALIAFLAISICSKASFLYPFNDCMDMNTYMTVGKGLTRGLLPYRDLYEQKGPILYFLMSLAARISPTNFIGFWFLECISAFFFLLYVWKILRLFSEDRALFWIPVMACIIYSSGAFTHGGTVEELCLPFLTYALFLGIRSALENKEISLTEMLLIGVTSAIILWTKYSLLGFYFGWIIMPFCAALKNKALRHFLSGIFIVVAGIALVSIPILVWFAAQGALGDLLQTYFYNNIFIYGRHAGVWGKIRNMISGVHLSLVYLPIPVLLMIFGFVYYCRRNLRIAMLFLLPGICTVVAIFSGGQGIHYYPLALAPLSLIGILALDDCLRRGEMTMIKRRLALVGLTLASMLCMYRFSSNTYMMKYQETDFPQLKFREIICREETPTLLNYGFLDGGFYTACKIYPEFKYFCRLNIKLPEMYVAQAEYIAKKIPLFIVTRDREFVFPGYQRVASASYYHEGRMHDYYLYRLE